MPDLEEYWEDIDPKPDPPKKPRRTWRDRIRDPLFLWDGGFAGLFIGCVVDLALDPSWRLGVGVALLVLGWFWLRRMLRRTLRNLRANRANREALRDADRQMRAELGEREVRRREAQVDELRRSVEIDVEQEERELSEEARELEREAQRIARSAPLAALPPLAPLPRRVETNIRIQSSSQRGVTVNGVNNPAGIYIVMRPFQYRHVGSQERQRLHTGSVVTFDGTNYRDHDRIIPPEVIQALPNDTLREATPADAVSQTLTSSLQDMNSQLAQTIAASMRNVGVTTQQMTEALGRVAEAARATELTPEQRAAILRNNNREPIDEEQAELEAQIADLKAELGEDDDRRTAWDRLGDDF